MDETTDVINTKYPFPSLFLGYVLKIHFVYYSLKTSKLLLEIRRQIQLYPVTSIIDSYALLFITFLRLLFVSRNDVKRVGRRHFSTLLEITRRNRFAGRANRADGRPRVCDYRVLRSEPKGNDQFPSRARRLNSAQNPRRVISRTRHEQTGPVDRNRSLALPRAVANRTCARITETGQT